MTTNYQQVYIKGTTKQEPFQRECAERYEIIKPLLERYQRRFSLFDLGANLGYFTLRTQAELDCFSVAADRVRGPLKDILRQNNPASAVWLNKHFTAHELSLLADCEQFDVGLVLNVLHHFPDVKDSLRALMALKRLCRFLILEICPPDGDTGAKYPHTHKAIYEAVTSDPHAELIAETRSHLKGSPPRYIYLIDNGITGFTSQQSFDARERCPHRSQCKMWLPVDDQPTVDIVKADKNIDQVFEFPFIPGMNLWNMVLLGYAWPGKSKLLTEFEIILEAVPHDDPLPWNWIYDGKLHAIDNGFKPKQKKFPCDALRLFKYGKDGM